MIPDIDPAWAGKVAFYELLFGTWTVYIFLVLLWERALGVRLSEWRYVLLNFIGAGAFWINHYFQYAPFWMATISIYTLVFIVVWWQLGVRGQPKTTGWKATATAASLLYTVAFIAFEMTSRIGVQRFGLHEFVFMAVSYAGFIGVILWRGRAVSRSKLTLESTS
jgi:hypothetical protein